MTDPAFLHSVRTLFNESIIPEAHTKEQKEIRSYLLDWPRGKMIRPRLVRFSALICDTPPVEMINAAAAVELLHTASLIHDDILDQGKTRRGMITLHRKYSPGAAVLAGDDLLLKGLELLTPYPRDLIDRAVASARTAVGAVAEELSPESMPTVASWEAVARGKTGELFGWALGSAAAVKQEPEGFDVLHREGCDWGLLFQALDDAKDMIGRNTGKDPGQDARNGTPNLYQILGDEEFRYYINRKISGVNGFLDTTPPGARKAGEKILKTIFEALPEFRL